LGSERFVPASPNHADPLSSFLAPAYNLYEKFDYAFVIHLPIQYEFAADVVYHLSCAAYAPDGAPGILSHLVASIPLRGLALKALKAA
jgi:hypothetical protein